MSRETVVAPVSFFSASNFVIERSREARGALYFYRKTGTTGLIFRENHDDGPLGPPAAFMVGGLSAYHERHVETFVVYKIK